MTEVTALESKVLALEKRISTIEKKLDYLIYLLERGEDLSPEEIEKLDRIAERIEKGEEPVIPAEKVFKKFDLNIS